MAGQRRRVNFNNQEQVLSSDLNRIGILSGTELQDHDMLRAVRADFYNPASNAADDFSAAGKGAQAIPISGVIYPPSVDAIGGSFDVQLGGGDGDLYTGVPVTDQSMFAVVRWAAQRVTWPSPPDASNPRIDLIIATPADAQLDQTSRNILVNPSTRTTTPANVFKSNAPQATISVVTGTAAATPLPPDVPAGSLAVLEVIVPAAAGDSTAYAFIRRGWRRIEFPGTSQHGIVKGCVPNLDVDSGSLGIPDGLHRIAIDGELLTWNQVQTLPIQGDLNNPPSAAGASDAPLYLYLAGGRNALARSQGISLSPTPGSWAPVVIVQSATAPDGLGYPTADLSITWGGGTLALPRAGCCYIGLAFFATGTSNILQTYYDGDKIRSRNTVKDTTTGDLRIKGFLEPDLAATMSFTHFTLGSLPAISKQIEAIGAVAGASSSITFANAGATDHAFAAAYTPSSPIVAYTPTVVIDRTTALQLYYNAVTGSGLFIPTAYSMHVPRLAH